MQVSLKFWATLVGLGGLLPDKICDVLLYFTWKQMVHLSASKLYYDNTDAQDKIRFACNANTRLGWFTRLPRANTTQYGALKLNLQSCEISFVHNIYSSCEFLHRARQFHCRARFRNDLATAKLLMDKLILRDLSLRWVLEGYPIHSNTHHLGPLWSHESCHLENYFSDKG